MENKAFSKPGSFLEKLKAVFAGGTPDEHIEGLEEAMAGADVDLSIISALSAELKTARIRSFEAAKDFLKQRFFERLSAGISKTQEKTGPEVVLLVGINGAGKTSTAAKLAGLYKRSGKKVLFIAADTFRAAATEQLDSWAEKAGVEITKGMDGADPASVVFDGLAAAKKGGFDRIIIDSAGRLHTKGSLMQELEKMKRIILKGTKPENLDIFIVVDANTGKNAYSQAKQFNETLGLTGVILTKFDSSAKGGSVVRIRSELKLPITYFTFGEKMEDIEEFDPKKFVDKLFE